MGSRAVLTIVRLRVRIGGVRICRTVPSIRDRVADAAPSGIRPRLSVSANWTYYAEQAGNRASAPDLHRLDPLVLAARPWRRN